MAEQNAGSDPVYPAPAGMNEVTKDEFFSRVGCRNVHPWPVGPYDPTWGYRSDWTLHGGSGGRIGVSVGGTHLARARYYVIAEEARHG